MTNFRAFLRGLDVYDALGVAGVLALIYGVSLWSGPAAWVTAGVLMIAAATAPLRKGRTS